MEDDTLPDLLDSSPGSSGPSLTYNRLSATETQLDTAIRAYFLWDDLPSALTLAGAAERVLSDIQPKDGIFGVDAYSSQALVNLYIIDEHQRKALNLFRHTYDQLRHADRPRDALHTIEINIAYAEFYILVAILGFRHVRRFTTSTMKAFFIWYVLNHPGHIRTDSELFDEVHSAGYELLNLPKPTFFELAISRINGA
jgi:hypothetical protein